MKSVSLMENKGLTGTDAFQFLEKCLAPILTGFSSVITGAAVDDFGKVVFKAVVGLNGIRLWEVGNG